MKERTRAYLKARFGRNVKDGSTRPGGPTSCKDETCLRCGKIRRKHDNGRLWTCDVSDDVIRALREFRDQNGRPWKLRLIRVWNTREVALPYLLGQARDLVGPQCLKRLDLDCGLPRDQRSIRPNRPEA